HWNWASRASWPARCPGRPATWSSFSGSDVGRRQWSRPRSGRWPVSRTALIVTHTGRPDIAAHAHTVSADLIKAGFTVGVIEDEAGHLDLPGVTMVRGPGAAATAEIVLALGGDGTLLRAAELARPAG